MQSENQIVDTHESFETSASVGFAARRAKINRTLVKPNELKIKATIEFDLPLNGQWSDLQASFVLFEIENNRYALNFEHIWRPYNEDSD